MPGRYHFNDHHYLLSNWLIKHNFSSIQEKNAKYEFRFFWPFRWYHDYSNFDQLNLDRMDLQEIHKLFPWGEAAGPTAIFNGYSY